MQVELEPEYQAYVYEAVPPDAWKVRVKDWPASMIGVEGVMEPATSAVSTVTKSVPELTVGAFVDESLTE